MFFAPPKVKALSRYSEFGVHLGEKYFFIMLAIAIVIHVGVVGIYAMSPREEVVKIPVRVLNIKLAGGGNGRAAPTIAPQEPVAPNMPGVSVRAETPVAAAKVEAKTVQKLVDKQLNKTANANAITMPRSNKHARTLASVVGDPSLAVPKKYVRAADATDTVGGTGNGKGTGQGGGEEAIRRYEQTLSLWLAQHKTYPEAARAQGIEGDAVIRIRINRTGNVLYYTIERSSGNPDIDQAALEMAQRSNPVPRAPDDYPEGSQMEFLIPVSFRLQ